MKLTEISTKSHADIIAELKTQYNGVQIGACDFQVYGTAPQVTVSYDLTFRRNTRQGAFKQYTSDISKANKILTAIAEKFKAFNPTVNLVTLDKAKASDDRKEDDGDSAYSEYEQSLGGEVKFAVNKVAEDKVDKISVDVPLFIRLLEYAREDAKTDMDLHTLTEKIIKASKLNHTLSMKDYDSLVS